MIFALTGALVWALTGELNPTELVTAAVATLDQDRAAALAALDRAGLESESDRDLRGLILLSTQDRRGARALLVAPRLAAYRAMAEQGDAGGEGRAQEVLAKAAQAPDAEPETLFLAALAFASRGQEAQAQALLTRALGKASALAAAYAPDPAERLAREIERLANPLPSAEAARLEAALLAHGRYGAVLARAEQPAVALEQLLSRSTAKGVEAAANVADAESKLRAEPKSDLRRAALIDALLAEGKLERAQALALELLEHHSSEVDPYGRLAKIATARGQPQKAKLQAMRSEAHRAELDRRRAELWRRQRAIQAVADAESGVGIAGLEAQRLELIRLSLPFDLAIARQGKPGEARAARDRILAACGPHFADFLNHQGPWERFDLALKLYGKLARVSTALPAADPARCAAR